MDHFSGDKMPKATITDISLTKSYIPKVSKIPGISPTIAQFYKPIENRNIHEGRVVDQAYYNPTQSSTVFTNEWDLSSLKYSQETKGAYCTDLPTLDDIHRLLKLERVVVDRTIKGQTVSLNPNQILTKELSLEMKQWEELIRENVFGLGGYWDRLPTCLAHMLYCVVAEEQYNLAYFFVKRIQCARATPTANIPIYDIVERVMCPLALKQTRRPRSDRGKARHSISSLSSHHQGTSSHQHDDDDDDVETSRASTQSPTTYLNSLNPLEYQNYQMPSASEQTDETLFKRQTTLLNQTQQMHKEMRGGFKSFEKALKEVFSKKKKYLLAMMSCGNGAHIGYNCPPKVPIISNPEQCNQTINELPQTLPSVHPTCNYEDENSFTYDSKPNSFNDSPSVLTHPPQLQFETYLCELCGNNAHYGYDCPPQFPLVYEQEPCYNQNFNDNYFPQNSQSSSQQYLCCENCGGPHETFQCQPMNEDYYEQNSCYDPNSFGFDQYQPPQFPVNYPPQETSREILQAQEDLMEAIQAFLKEYDHIPPNKKCMALLLADERFLKIKQVMREEHNQPEVMQELLLKLMDDL
ncbi:hypothetical protein Tco_0283136 [Tanacetum coccineum]